MKISENFWSSLCSSSTEYHFSIFSQPKSLLCSIKISNPLKKQIFLNGLKGEGIDFKILEFIETKGTLPFRMIAAKYGADITYGEEIIIHKIIKYE
ncbi:hypothetical protein P3L10_012960 [Capsicum annuum]